TGGADTVSNATAALANLAERNDGNKSIIGGTPRCIATLFRVAATGEQVAGVCNATTVAATGEQAAGVCNATCALANLAADHRPNKRAISATPGAFQIMVQLVASSNVETQSNAACALANMTADEHDAKCALAEVPFAFGALVNLARDASQPAQCNACRAIANSVSLHEDNQHAVAGVRGVFPALVALAATEEEMGQIHTVAALALANLTDANADNCRSVCVEPGALDALVRISTLAGEEGRRHAIRALANLSEFYDNRAAIVATHAAVPCLLQGSVDSSDAIATTAAFCLAKLSDHTDKLILHIADTPACFERLSECVSRGSYRAISNAAVCFCHLSAKRHSVSVRIAETKGAIRALAEAATAPLPVDGVEIDHDDDALEAVDGVEIDDDDDGGEAGEQKRLQRAVAEYVVASREEKPTTQDVEAAEDARRSTSFAIASVASNKGPAGHAIRALPKIRGVLKALVWVLSSPTASPDMLLPSSLPTETAPGMEERSAGDGARVLPRANAAAALANMADGDSGNVVAIVQTAGSLEGLVAAAAQRDWEHLRLHAARALANLCFFFSARTRVAATPGAIPALVAMLSSKAGACKVHAARALANLTTNHNGNRKAVVADPDAVAALVKLAIHGSAEARAHSARALGNMADTGPDASTIIGQAKNALEAAILLLTNGLAQMSEEKYRWDGKTRGPSKTADGESGRDNHENDRDEHDVEPFMLVDGCYLISALAVTDQVREAIAARPGAIDLLIKAANCGMAEARTNAVKALAGLACNNERVSNLICSHEASISTMISICLEQGKEEGVDEVSAAAIRVLVNIVDATLLGRQVMCDKQDALLSVVSMVMCDKDKALLSVVNMVALGTPAAKGNACYLLANLLELGEEIMMKLVAINGAVMAVVSVVSTGSDFAMGNASRVLGNVVKDNLQVAGEMASNREALMALVTVVQAL
ncbi:armadillo-type protein, partial [Baffinella frigidus]